MGFLGFCFGDGIWYCIVGFDDFGIGEVGEAFWLELEKTLILNFERENWVFVGLDFSRATVVGLCICMDSVH